MEDKTTLNYLKKKIGDIDVLCVPVGQTLVEKKSVIETTLKIMKPKIVIPMHYFKLDQKKQFISDLKKNYKVEDISVNNKTINKNDLQSIGKTVIWNMTPGKYSN